ncbi:unnamed protein product [marine sediment metagenome]|uniref:Uncharacterized protein n=1 Tax=marine sediment metagenome TaxID=412755 RepID=X0WJH5_9ZZZZ
MNLNMGSQKFENVEIPLLWGKRAILEDKKGRISIISLEGAKAVIEVLGNKPAPNIQYELIEDGFKIIVDGQELYSYDPGRRIITGFSIKLPECEIQSTGIRIGTNMFSGNIIIGSGVGIVVDERGIGMGAPLPEGLAKLVV